MFQVLAVTMEIMAGDTVLTVQVQAVALVHRLVAAMQEVTVRQTVTSKTTAEVEARLIILAREVPRSEMGVGADVPVAEDMPAIITNL